MSPTTRSGFCTLFGRPNVGKSTLLNALVGERLAIVSPRPQTTRERLRAIYNHPDGSQVVFVDTPGLHRLERDSKALNRHMVEEALAALEGVDVLCFVTEVEPRRPGRGTASADGTFRPHPLDAHALAEIDRVTGAGRKGAGGQGGGPPAFRGKLVLVLNKIDRLKDKRQLLPLMAGFDGLRAFDAIVPVSATRADGIVELRETLIGLLPEGSPLFPPDQITDRPERYLAAELIREQVLAHLREEVPHATAVSIELWQERETSGARPGRTGRRAPEPLTAINAVIHVERDSQKAIVLGKGGRMIKRIGQAAREAIEELLGRRVYLELFVRVDPDWRNDPMALRRLGIL